MPWGALIGAVGGIAGGALGAKGSKDAAKYQADAALEADRLAREERKPWTDAGKYALGELQKGLAEGGEFRKRFSMDDAKNSEAYKFALSEGLGALNNSAAARGGLLGTNNQRDNMKYAAGLAGQFQNQAFNQWLSEQQQLLQPLQSLAGQGFTSASQTADTTANAMLAAGGARAAGSAGASNAWGNALSGVGNSLIANQDNLKKLFGPSGSSFNMGSNLTPLSSSEFGDTSMYTLGGP